MPWQHRDVDVVIAAPEGFNPRDQSASRRERLLLAMNTRHCHGLCVFQPYKLDEKPVTPTSKGVWLSVEAVRNLPGKPFESLLSGTSIVGQFGTGTVPPSHKLAQVCQGPPLVLLSFYNNTKKKTRLKTLTSLFFPLVSWKKCFTSLWKVFSWAKDSLGYHSRRKSSCTLRGPGMGWEKP